MTFDGPFGQPNIGLGFSRFGTASEEVIPSTSSAVKLLDPAASFVR